MGALLNQSIGPKRKGQVRKNIRGQIYVIVLFLAGVGIIWKQSNQFDGIQSIPSPQQHQIGVCSHRMNGGELRVGFGIRAMQLLWKNEITCFDVDCMLTKDEQLIVGHPRTLQSLLPSSSDEAQELTVQQLRDRGLDENMAPTVEELLYQYSILVNERKKKLGKRSMQEFQPEPLLAIELKKQAMQAKYVRHVLKQVAKKQLNGNVALWIDQLQSPPDKETSELLSTSKCIYSIPDYVQLQTNPDPRNFTLTDLQHIKTKEKVEKHTIPYMYGPSINAQNKVLRQIKNVVLRNKSCMILWVVDTLPQIRQALKYKPRYIISNYPLLTAKMLKSIPLQEQSQSGDQQKKPKLQ